MGAPKQKWTAEEELALKAGVVKHGPGKWRTILKDPEFSGVLCLRSNVDLKDKWRNLSVTANGWGSREKARLALKKSRHTPKHEEEPLALITADDQQDEMVDDRPVTAASPILQLPAVKKSSSKMEDLILDAITNLEERGGSNKTSIATYIEDQYSAPPNLKKMLSIKLKALTATGKLTKAKRKYRIPPSSYLLERRSPRHKVLLLEGRQKEPSRVGRNDVKVLTKSQIDADLARMRSMTAEEASLVAARAVVEAEVAIAEAEEAAREAEAAEADAEAAEAFAEASLKTLHKRAKSVISKSSKH